MDKPEANKTYMLVGGSNVKSIANGDSWAESEVKPELTYSEKAMKNKVKKALDNMKSVLFESRFDASDVDVLREMMVVALNYDGYAVAEVADHSLRDCGFFDEAKILRYAIDKKHGCK